MSSRRVITIGTCTIRGVRHMSRATLTIGIRIRSISGKSRTESVIP